MKLYLDSNTVEGTPEEILEYQQLLEDKNQSDKYKIITDKLNKAKHTRSEDDTEESNTQYFKEHPFWYLKVGTSFSRNNGNVLKTAFGSDDLLLDSKGNIYFYQSVRDSLLPFDREDIREEFEEAQIEGALLKYYPVLDEFAKL